MTIKSLAKSLAILTVLTLGFGVGTPASAQNKSSPVQPSMTQQAPEAPGTTPPAEILSRTWIQTQAGQCASCTSSLSPGFFSLVYEITVPCPSARGCTFGFEDMIQVQSIDGPPCTYCQPLNYAICPKVDGVFTNPPCPFQPAVPLYNVGPAGIALQTGVHVAPGTHILQVYVFADGPGVVVGGVAIYRAYVP